MRPIVNALPYVVAVPTTAGTGRKSAASRVISDDDTHVKRIDLLAALLAQVVFADPELTFGLPPAITAATGMDALTHNVESYLSPAYHPLCDGIALEGTRIAARSLAHGGARAVQPGRAQRHDDELDDGRDRLPEGPGRRALVRPCARRGLRPAPRAGQRADDRARCCASTMARRRPSSTSSRTSSARAAARELPALAREPQARRSASPPASRARRRQARTVRRAWWTSPRRTPATRPTRARSRATDFERFFAEAM